MNLVPKYLVYMDWHNRDKKENISLFLLALNNSNGSHVFIKSRASYRCTVPPPGLRGPQHGLLPSNCQPGISHLPEGQGMSEFSFTVLLIFSGVFSRTVRQWLDCNIKEWLRKTKEKIRAFCIHNPDTAWGKELLVVLGDLEWTRCLESCLEFEKLHLLDKSTKWLSPSGVEHVAICMCLDTLMASSACNFGLLVQRALSEFSQWHPLYYVNISCCLSKTL